VVLSVLFAPTTDASTETLLEQLRSDHAAMVSAEQDFHSRRDRGILNGKEAADYASYVAGLHRRVAEDCVALAEQGKPEAARAAWEAGVEGIDAGSRASRALAEGFWHAAFLERGSDDASVHRQGIVDALRAADAIRDPIVRDFADRLRAKLPAG